MNKNEVYSYKRLLIDLYMLKHKYPFIKIGEIGKSVLGNSIPYIKIGKGNKKVLYVAGFHSNEWICCKMLIKFVYDFCGRYALNSKIYVIPAKYIFNNVSLYIIPMLNIDTINLLAGVYSENSKEYKHYVEISNKYPNIPFPNGWKANYNGVDLNLQFPAGWKTARKIKYLKGIKTFAPRDYVGKHPLSEPESIAIYNFTIKNKFNLVLTYHTQGKEIYWQYKDYATKKAKEIGKIFSNISGYKLTEVPFNSSFAGYKDWFLQKYRKPAYTIEAGIGDNPLPNSQFKQIYEDNLGILILGLIL